MFSHGLTVASLLQPRQLTPRPSRGKSGRNAGISLHSYHLFSLTNAMRMLKQILTVLPFFSLLLTDGFALSKKEKHPKLVVLIAVDGLRADLLDRYDVFFRYGFRRLRDHGMRFSQAMVDHAISVSHPGHVTLSTGLVPARHGIVDAAFYLHDGQTLRFVDALKDSAEQILGVPNAVGVSPKKILSRTLPEWFATAGPNSRMVAIGAGQFSALLHAGHARGDVYWFMEDAGRFVTSTYYRQDYPEWVEHFNQKILPRFITSSSLWESTASPEARATSRQDEAQYEGYEGRTKFPHIFRDAVSPDRANDARALSRWFADTPMLDAATLALAQEAIQARLLGQGQSVVLFFGWNLAGCAIGGGGAVGSRRHDRLGSRGSRFTVRV
jgi:hypothetical protein